MYSQQKLSMLMAGVVVLFAVVLSLSISVPPPGLAFAQEPTPIPATATLPVVPPAELPVIYDSFINARCDGSYNPNLWQPASRGTTQIIQQEGVLVLANTIPSAPDDDGVVLHLNNWSEPVFGFFEARILISKQKSQGTNGMLALNVYVNEKLDDEAPTINPRGWVQIGLTYGSYGSTLLVNEENGQSTQTWAALDTWYTIRIEFNERTNSFEFFWDDQFVTSVSIDNLVQSMPETSSLELVPAIQLWHNSDTALTAYLDYVRISR